MIENTLEQGSSFVHKLEPRTRIPGAVFISFAAALCRHPGLILVYLAIGICLAIAAGMSVRQAYVRLRPLFWFLVMIWLFLPTTFGGEVIYQYGIVKISRPGILLSLQITLKSIAILLIFSALIATMPMAALGAGLHQLKVPDKMVFLLLMTYRYIAVIQEEYSRLLRAARFRGFSPGTNIHSYKTFAFLAGMLFVRASFRAKRVYQAMLCRGFKQKFHTLDEYPPNRLNFPFLATMVLSGTILMLTDIIWIG